MKTSSWVILVVAGVLTLLGSLFSLGIAYSSLIEDRIGPATLTELSVGRPEVATAVRARRATAAAYGAGFATLFLAKGTPSMPSEYGTIPHSGLNYLEPNL